MKGRHWFIAMPGQSTAVSTEQCSSQWNHGVLSQPCGVIKSSTMSDPCTLAVCVTSSSPPNLSLCRENRETMCALCMASFAPMLLIECRAFFVVFFYFYHSCAAADGWPWSRQGDAICDNDIHSTISFTQTSFYCKTNFPFCHICEVSTFDFSICSRSSEMCKMWRLAELVQTPWCGKSVFEIWWPELQVNPSWLAIELAFLWSWPCPAYSPHSSSPFPKRRQWTLF